MAVPREETYEYNGADIYIGTDGEGEFYANFMRGRGDPIGIDVNNTLTVPVNFFLPL